MHTVLGDLAFNMTHLKTSGFKGRQTTLQPWFSVFKEAEKNSSQVDRGVTYPVSDRRHLNFREGRLKHTQNPLHIGLQGRGFLLLADGSVTRNGNIHVNRDGILETAEGVALENGLGGGPLKIDRNPSDIRITKDGNIFADDGNLVGALALREFDDPDTLRQRSGNRLLPSDDPGQPALMTRVYQGYLEGANFSAPVMMAQLNQASTDYKQSATMMRTTIRSYQDLTSQLLVAS